MVAFLFSVEKCRDYWMYITAIRIWWWISNGYGLPIYAVVNDKIPGTDFV
jgi:hypothetical protein